jgi:hypothetical protein
VKPEYISELIRKTKLISLQQTVKTRDLYRGINEFERGYQL